jgi:RNA polymerase sigma-70 factor (ECF subfamily)
MSAAALQQQSTEQELAEALRAGDERAFLALVERLHAPMVRFARGFLGSEAAAEDVVQDTWAAVLQGIGQFEGRSAVRPWVFAILANVARTRAGKEGRSVPLSDLESEDDSPAVDPSEFLPDSHPRWAGHWQRHPEPWPEAQVLARETMGHVADAIARLPEGQRAVIQLRDIEGFSAPEVCATLGVSEINQRVLLHRARSRVRRELSRHLQRSAP